MRRGVAAAALIAVGAAASAAAPAGAATRHYWVAAVPVSWNTVPNQHDAIMGVRYDPSETVFGTVVYRRYSRNWKRPMRNLPPGSGDNDGMPGPGGRLPVSYTHLTLPTKA